MASTQDISARIVEQAVIGPDIYRLAICREDSQTVNVEAQPGQFAMLKTGSAESDDPLLRRPLSIHTLSADAIQFVYKIVGKGTRLLSQMRKGDRLDVLLPLGKGFTIEENRTPCLVGGGIGIAPLLFLAEKLQASLAGKKLYILLGARDREELIAVESFSKLAGADVYLSTDNGSAGHHGFVTDLLRRIPIRDENPIIYSCGPEPMMHSVARFCAEQKWECQVSLEALMACGMGACLGCAVSRKDLADTGYLHVCTDGPVFKADTIW